MARRAIGRLLAAAIAAVSALACSTAAAWAWCAAVFGLLGFPPSETVFLVLPAAVLTALAAAEAVLARVVPFVRPPGPWGAAWTAFFVAAAAAAAWIGLVGERRLAFPNAADLALAGLVLGIPSGLLSHYSAKGARKIVDACLRVL